MGFKFLLPAILSIGLFAFVDDGCCTETYSIDDSPLFLYKTINWWYDSLPKDDGKLCKRPIKCINKGNARIAYDEPNKKVDIIIRNGFASMLLAVKKCKQCYGPSFFHPTWLHPKYFMGATATVVLDESSIIKGITFSDIEKQQACRIRRMGPDLAFVLEGVIGGLSNDRIALHASGELLKKCKQGSRSQDDDYPIFLKLVNAKTDDIIAKFEISWER